MLRTLIITLLLTSGALAGEDSNNIEYLLCNKVVAQLKEASKDKEAYKYDSEWNEWFDGLRDDFEEACIAPLETLLEDALYD